MDSAELLYVADPMCSWCWGFQRVLTTVEARLPEGVHVRLVLGGLAKDSDEPMDDRTREYVQRAWDEVESRTGASFNREFWSVCAPRRSTWRSCRAVLAAGDRGRPMFEAIQRAYYAEARNPSDRDTLIDLADDLGLDAERFAAALDAPGTQSELEEHFALRDRLGARSFPTLVLRREEGSEILVSGWAEEATVLSALRAKGVALSGSEA